MKNGLLNISKCSEETKDMGFCSNCGDNILKDGYNTEVFFAETQTDCPVFICIECCLAYTNGENFPKECKNILFK